MTSHFTESNRLISVFPDLLHGRVAVTRELELKDPLSPQVSWGDIHTELGNKYNTALWLDGDCFLVSRKWLINVEHRHRRYRISVRQSEEYVKYFNFDFYQNPATTERGAPLPALEYFLNRLTNIEEHWLSLSIRRYGHADDYPWTLDISPACFANLLQTSGEVHRIRGSVQLWDITLTAEQTMLLYTHNTSPIFIKLWRCRFHGHTLLQLGSAVLQREQTHLLGRGSYLYITLADDEIGSLSLGELSGLLSNPHLRDFRPFGTVDVSYEEVKKFVMALAACNISRLDHLYLSGRIEWEREEEPSAWIGFWKAIEVHPSLKEVMMSVQPVFFQQSWWQPIAAAVKVNPRLVHLHIWDLNDRWKTELAQHVEPLLERNRFRPKIAALCCTDPSKMAVLLGQAIVAVASKKDAKYRLEILQMLVEQLVRTGYDFGVGVGRAVGKKHALAETDVVVPDDAFANKYERREADCTAASTNDDNNNES